MLSPRLVVAQIVLSLNFGGLEYLTIQLSEQLERRGIRSHIISLTDGVLIGEANQRGIETTALNKKAGFDAGTVFRIGKILRERGIGLVHTHNLSPLVHGTLAAAMTGTRSVNTRHGPDPQSTYGFIWGMNDRVVAVSDHARRELVKYNHVNPDKIRVILNGIDLSPYSSPGPTTNPLREEFQIGAGTKIVGNFSRLEPEKDQKTLLRAFRILMDQGVNARLVIAGGGKLEGELKQLTQDLDLTNDVHFLGFRKGIPDLLRCIDLYVVSSTMEGLSLSLLQAMAAGLPVVATNTGGNPEVVVEGETGYIVDCGNPAALAAAMSRVLACPETAQRMGHSAKDNAYRLFGIDRMVESYISLYEEVLAKRN
jgi:glycosyltransferase involved in cell wall biosynthesis